MPRRGGALKFGAFIPPQNRVDLSPNLAIRRTVELIEHLDRLGYDEAWVGEHHSGGAEIVASPELILASAGERTRQIRLGTGVISLPYHHPFQVAERMVLLDHLTRGRVIFGCGPGSLAPDAWMHGIDPTQLRPRMQESLDVILKLLAGETVTRRAEWFTLERARLQLEPFSDLEVSVVGTISPSGPKLAGRHGLGILSIAATDPTGTDRLPQHWEIMEHEAQRHGHVIDRSRWRLAGPMHIAETLEQAKREVRYGLKWQYEYRSHISPSTIAVPHSSDALVDLLNTTGRGVIGTPDMAAAQIERLIERSGGFGTYLFQDMNIADWEASLRSYTLFAEEVAPRFDRTLAPVLDSYERVIASSAENRDATSAARRAAQDQYQRERTSAARSTA
jgi:limonene 1,2-monooxygenase